jgi:hypothetical protein
MSKIWLIDSRLLGLRHVFSPHSTGLTAMAPRCGGYATDHSPAGLYVSNLRQLSSPGCMLRCQSKVPTQYRQVTAAPVETK